MTKLTRQMQTAQEEAVPIHRRTPFVLRYAPTCLGPKDDGMRRLMLPAQGHKTFDTPELAQQWLSVCIEANDRAMLERLYGDVTKFGVSEVECWPVHHDPKRIYFELDEVI